MRKILWALLLAFVIAVPAATPVRVYAETKAADETSTAELTDSDMTWIAGRLLTDIMDLILDQYAGGEVSAETLYEAALYGMSGILDAYSEYLDEDELDRFSGALSGKLTGIGVVIRTNEDGKPEIIRVLPDSPAMEAGLCKGDILIMVNGKLVSNRPVDEIVSLITDPAVQRAALQIKRDKSFLTFSLLKREIKSVTVFTDRLESLLGEGVKEKAKDFRYININSISGTTADDLRTALSACEKEGVKGIVLDMRGNAGGYLDIAVDICAQLLPKGPVYHTVDSKGNKETFNSSLEKAPFDKTVVLVDRDTASAAELITAALQDAKAAYVIGETTFGKGVIQTLFPLPTGGALKLTTEEYLRRSGEPLNKLGVTPDAVVDMRRAEYETENDAALIKALEWLGGK